MIAGFRCVLLMLPARRLALPRELPTMADGDLLAMFDKPTNNAGAEPAQPDDGDVATRTILPVCLISQDGSGEASSLKIHEEGLDILRGLGATPVATLSVAGMYRTGKSFFLIVCYQGH